MHFYGDVELDTKADIVCRLKEVYGLKNFSEEGVILEEKANLA